VIALAIALQVVSTPPVVNTSGLATKAEVQAAQAKADAAQTAASTACQPSATLPPMETVGGAAGSGDACRLANAIQPRITRVAVGTTVTGGTVSVTWPAMTAVPSVFPIPRIASSATQVPICASVSGSTTTTGTTVKCFTTQSVTVSILGAVVAPITTTAAGVTVDILAIPQS
jgi:hypothetical protein